LASGQSERFVNVVRDLGTFVVPAWIAGQHDVTTAGQEAWQALERLSAHHHDAPHSQCLEALEIGRKVPGELAVPANDPVLGPGDDKGDPGLLHDAPLPLSRRPAKQANEAE
jgi:hypothetical protein